MFLDYVIKFFGIIASVTTVIGIIPQCYKSYQTKSMDDVSMGMLINYMICSIAWLCYGICTSEPFVAGCNVLCVITSVVSLWQKKHYSKTNDT
jgi:MtN3 and saliva related transmembrane protein